MLLKRLALCFLALTFGLFVSRVSASPPVGVPPKDVAEAFSKSDVVFLGKVEKVTKDKLGFPSMAEVRVQTFWKGGEFLKTTIDVDGSGGTTHPARVFEVGQTYIFFLPVRKPGGGFRADSYLDRVLPQSEALEDLRFLSTLKAQTMGPGPTNR